LIIKVNEYLSKLWDPSGSGKLNIMRYDWLPDNPSSGEYDTDGNSSKSNDDSELCLKSEIEKLFPYSKPSTFSKEQQVVSWQMLSFT